MRIAITGSSGLIGTAIAARLREEGHAVVRVVRSREAAAAEDAVYWKPSQGEVDPEGLAGVDAVINLAGENIAGIWTAAKKRRVYDSRVGGTRLLAETLASLPPEHRPGIMINASAKGFYGDRPSDHPLTEDAPAGSTFMARLVADWEVAADPAREVGMRVVHTRFGLVLDPDSLLLKGMAIPSRFGLGAKLGDGQQIFPWVTRREIANVIPFILRTAQLHGPVNVVAPQKVTNEELADSVARVQGRPRVLAVPELVLRLTGDLGEDILASTWVVPEKLRKAGYTWVDPELEPALRRMLNNT